MSGDGGGSTPDQRGLEQLRASLDTVVLAFAVWNSKLECIQLEVHGTSGAAAGDDGHVSLRGTAGEFLRRRIEEVFQVHHPIERVYLPVGTPPLWSSQITLASFYPSFDADGNVTAVSMVVTPDKQPSPDLIERDEFRLMVEHTSDYSMLLIDTAGSIMCWNAANEEMFQHTSEEMIGRHFSLLYAREDAGDGARMPSVAEALAQQRLEQDTWLIRNDGSRFYASVVMTPVAQDLAPRLLMICNDLTKRKQATDRLQKYADRQRALADFSDKALSRALPQDLMREVIRIIGDTVEANKSGVYLMTPGRDRLTLRAGEGWAAQDVGRLSARMDGTTLASSVASTRRPMVIDDADQDDSSALSVMRYFGLRSGVAVPMELGDRCVGVLAAYRYQADAFGPDDVYFLQGLANVLAGALDRWNQDEVTRHQALHDPLTGLANRILLKDRIGHALMSARRNHGRGSLLIIDLDKFKEINDQLGHHAGDAVLSEIGRRLASVVRGSDTVARLGGDEFAVLVTDLTDEGDAEAVAQKVLGEIRRPIPLEHSDIHVDASVGIAPYTGQSDSEALLQEADVAMYRAKKTRSGTAVFQPGVDTVSTERLQTLTELRQADQRGDLALVYQPIVDLGTNELKGMEAFVRWHHPHRGLLLPDDFIPLAEQSGLMPELSRWILDNAMKQCAAWWQEGLKVPVTVNLGAQAFYDPALSDNARDTLDRSGLPGEALMFDVSEASLTASTVMATTTVEALAAIDVKVCVDDFGTGFSSLAHLSGLPLDCLKVDRTFVAHIGDHDGRTVTRSAIELAHSLDIDVLAEGIEDHDTTAKLREWGCDRGQGYYIARPMDAPTALGWMKKKLGRPARPGG